MIPPFCSRSSSSPQLPWRITSHSEISRALDAKIAAYTPNSARPTPIDGDARTERNVNFEDSAAAAELQWRSLPNQPPDAATAAPHRVNIISGEGVAHASSKT